jgi:hypothetical protein
VEIVARSGMSECGVLGDKLREWAMTSSTVLRCHYGGVYEYTQDVYIICDVSASEGDSLLFEYLIAHARLYLVGENISSP